MIAAQLDRVLRELAHSQRAPLIVVKEFEVQDCAWLDRLRGSGYLRAQSPPTYRLQSRFADLNDYLAALRHKRRNEILRWRRRMNDSGIQWRVLRGGPDAAALLSDQTHRLYDAVRQRGKTQLERLPAEFFRQLCDQFGDDARFVFLLHEGRVVAFLCAVVDESVCHLLFVGIDYSLNEHAALYFNVVMLALDEAFKSGSRWIHIGQAADDFKAQLGGLPVPLYFYIKGRGIWGLLLNWFAGEFLPPPAPSPSVRVFREDHQPQVTNTGG
jgi:predicted N-acyltransferase